jgi:hypothetical protein
MIDEEYLFPAALRLANYLTLNSVFQNIALLFSEILIMHGYKKAKPMIDGLYSYNLGYH